MTHHAALQRQTHTAVAHALAEDLGALGDITSLALISATRRATARIVAKQAGIIAGLAPMQLAFRHQARLRGETLDGKVLVADGTPVKANTVVAEFTGTAWSLLEAERVALNFLGHLSGIATVTHGVVRDIADTRAKVCCTRKTTPGLRLLEKYAVHVGGGVNHRFGLYDAILIKDNHLAASGAMQSQTMQSGAMKKLLATARGCAKEHATPRPVQVEVRTLAQVRAVMDAGGEAVLLDNMPVPVLRQAVALVDEHQGRAPQGKTPRLWLEASGGITPHTAVQVAATGVDVISLGWLTHSAPGLDVSMTLTPLATGGA